MSPGTLKVVDSGVRQEEALPRPQCMEKQSMPSKMVALAKWLFYRGGLLDRFHCITLPGCLKKY